jgi:vitamin B12 transporter
MNKNKGIARPPRSASLATAIASIAALGPVLPAAVFAQNADDAPLEELIVTSSIIETPRRQIGTAVSVIGADDIELRGYDSIADVLRTQPGIGVSNSGGPGKATSLRIRGEESFRTLLMIDGVKAVDPSAPQVAPSFDILLTTSDLERVEILRGPQGFIYGADAGGVVNILTRTGEGDLSGRLGIEAGAFDTRKYDASLAGGGDLGDYFLSVTDLETDGFNAQTADTDLRDDDGAENTTLHAKLGWNATDRLRLQLVARDIDASARYDGCFSTATFATIHDCVATTEQATYKVSAVHDTERFGNVFGYSNVDIVRDNLSEGISAFASEGSLSRFEYTGSFEPSEALTLVYGLDFQNEESAGDETLERDQEAYYIEYQGTFADRLYLSVGARYDDNEDFGTHTSARLSGTYIQDLNGGGSLKYRASVGTGFRPPSLFEVAYNAGPFAFPPASGTALTEESSRGHDVGIEYAATNDLRFEITYFDQEIEDEMFFDLAGFSGYLQSPGTSTSKGVEIAMQVPLGERWEVLGNWTHNDTENTASEQRLRRPENVGNIGLLYTAPTDKLRFVANYRLSKDSIDIGGVALDDYAVLDLSMAYAFSEKLELYGRLQNAADEDYQEVVGFRSARRSGYAGVRLRFQ